MTSVSIMRDITINLIIPCTATHHFVPLPPVPPIPPPLLAAPFSLAACAIEAPVNMMWPPGMALGSNKFTTTVVHQGMGIALDGHDCGCLIPHVQVTPAPNNMLTLVQIAFSSRKSMFVASTVVMNGKSPACCVMIAWPPSPMVYCADPMSPPLADAVTSYLNTVNVGMTLADWLIGALSIAASMAIDWVLRTKGASELAKTLGEAVLGKVIGVGSVGEFFARNGLAVATGLARLAFTDGPASVQIGIGSPYLQVQGSVDRAADGTYSGGVTGQAAIASGQVTNTGAQGSISGPTGSTQSQHTWGQSGSTTTTTDTSPSEGFRTQTTTTDTRGQVTTTDSGGRRDTGSLGAPL